jgi:DNA repair protein SbcD/Mre11
MKILHTSDWHLGQKFKSYERKDEHDRALDFILETIVAQNIDILIVAGDIFDIGSPPNQARKQYYNFLSKLLKTSLRHVVITGGNHDSPSMLDAPKELLQNLNIHIVAAATDAVEDELICLKNTDGKTECIVAAVPFLRDRDVFKNLDAEELHAARSTRLKEGIKKHFESVAELIVEMDDVKNIPVIATGHLTVTGSQMSDKQDNIYIGNIENIDAEMFPPLFDYVALGHIHRAQALNKLGSIRYSGSIIPLSFSEIQDKKSVTVLEFEGKKMKKHKLFEIPTYRKLIRFSGDKEAIFQEIEKLDQRLKLQLEESDKLKAWLEIEVVSETMIMNVDTEIRNFSRDKHVEILVIRAKNNAATGAGLDEDYDSQLIENEEAVFHKKCISKGVDEANISDLLITFRELRESLI